ncbi:MAG TPA: hypothetical protein VGK67_19555 [Myxococcales bacterium]|jgi:hypothetical protein
MKSLNALALALCALAALCACPGEKPVIPRPDAASAPASCDAGCHAEACSLPEDCGDVRVWDCVDSACVPACTSKTDCNSHPAYQGKPWPGCETGICVCDARQCVSSLCSGDGECAQGQVCRSGACGAPELDADSCSVTPDNVVLRKDEEFTFTATAYKGADVALVGADAFTFSAEDASVTVTDPNGILKGAAATVGYKEKAVKASLKARPSVFCFAKVLVLGAITNGARVAVVDELSGRLVPGAKAVINGTNMIEDAANKGVFTATNFDPPATITVFHQDYAYVTVAGLTKTDVLVPVRKSADATKGGGFQGRFTNFPGQDIAFGLAGTSIAGNYLDLDLDAVVGRLVDTSVTFSGETFLTPLPTGSMLAVGGTDFKAAYQAWGVAGSCLDEAATLAGTCGTSAAFGLMGSIPVSAATPIIDDLSAGKPLDAGRVLAQAIPYLKSFKSAVVRDVTYQLRPVPESFADLYLDPEAFPTKNFTPTVGLGLKYTVKVPDLPANLDAAAVLAAADVPGRGLVPLGMTGGTDTSTECPACTTPGKLIGIDVIKEDPLELAYHDDSKLTLRMAPAHSGIEGSPYGVVTLAFSTGGPADGSSRTSALVTTRKEMVGGSEITYSGGFLPAVEAASAYDYRAGKFNAIALASGLSIHRAVFTTDAGKKWIVYFNQASFTLPKVPTGFEDRTMADGLDRDAAKSPNSARSSLTYWALKAMDKAWLIDLDGLFDFTGGRAMKLSQYLTGFSIYESMPSLEFLAPTGAECGTNLLVPEACTVKDGTYTFKVKVRGLSVPGQVKLLAEAAPTGEKVLVSTMSADWVAEFKFETPLMKDDDLKNPHVITVKMVKPESTDKKTAVAMDPVIKASLKVIVEN